MKKELLSLTSIRFMAAFYVFLFHCQIHFGYIVENKVFNQIVANGQVAMTLFFILSGYILTHVYQDIEITAAKKYFINRFSRIYPTYFIFGLLSFPVLLNQLSSIDTIFLPQIGEQPIIIGLLVVISFVFMIQAWFPALIPLWNFGGSWSLSVEALFYLLFPVIRQVATLLTLKSLCLVLFFSWLWAGLPACYLNFFSSSENFLILNTYTYVSPIFRLGEFIFGVVFYVIFHERIGILLSRLKFEKEIIQLLLIFSYGILGFVMFQPPYLLGLNNLTFLIVPTFSLTIYYLHQYPVSFLERVVFVYLGKISYSFYLAQFFVFGMYKEEIKQLFMQTELCWLMTFVITLLISVTLYHLVEEPSRRYLKGKYASS